MIKASEAREQYYERRKKVIERKVKRILKFNKIFKTNFRYIWLKDDDLPYLSCWIRELGYSTEVGYTWLFADQRYYMYW